MTVCLVGAVYAPFRQIVVYEIPITMGESQCLIESGGSTTGNEPQFPMLSMGIIDEGAPHSIPAPRSVDHDGIHVRDTIPTEGYLDEPYGLIGIIDRDGHAAHIIEAVHTLSETIGVE